MKKTITVIASLFVTLVCGAQTIDVHKKDGTVVNYEASEVSYIGFSEVSKLPAPTGLSVGWEWLSDSYKCIELTWNPVNNAVYYEVYRSESKSGPYTNIDRAYSPECLDYDGYDYHYYKVSAVNNAGVEGAQSNPVSLMDFYPEPPTGLTANISSSCIELTWNSVSDATGYSVYRSTSADGEYKCIEYYTKSTYYSDCSVSVGTTYYYKVSAVNSIGVSEKSNYVSAEVSEFPAPSGLSLSMEYIGGGAGDVYPALTWNPVSNAAYYKVYGSESKSGPYTLKSTVYPQDGKYIDYSWLGSYTYYYKVSAVNNAGDESPQSNPVCLKDFGPEPPSGLSASTSSFCIELTWNSVADATSYSVYRSTSADGEYECIEYYTKSTYYSDCSVSVGTTYYYKVSARNSVIEGFQSNYVSAVVKKPEPPTGLSASATSSCIELTWNSVSNVSSYYVYRSTSSTGTYSKIGDVSTTSYSDCTVTPGTTYYYKVSSKNDVGEGERSDYVSAKVNITIPGIPSGLSASGNSSYIHLSWYSVSGAERYYVYRSTSATGTYSYLGSTASTSYNDYNITAGTTYYYKVSAWNSAGESSLSAYDYASVSGNEPCPPSVSCSGTSSVKLSWTANNSTGCGTPKSYRVVRSNRITGNTEVLTESTKSTSYTDYQPFPGVNLYGVSGTNDYGTGSAGAAYSSSVGIDAPYITKVYASSQGLDITIKDLDVPDEWKPYYSLQMYSSTSQYGTYYIESEWKYNDTVAHDYGNKRLTFERDYGIDMRGKNYYIKCRWVFEGPYSPSRTEGSFSSVETGVHK